MHVSVNKQTRNRQSLPQVFEDMPRATHPRHCHGADKCSDWTSTQPRIPRPVTEHLRMTIRFLSTLYTGRNGGGRVCKAIEHNESSSYPQLLASSCRPPQISSEITRQSRLPVGEALPGLQELTARPVRNDTCCSECWWTAWASCSCPPGLRETAQLSNASQSGPEMRSE